MQTLSDDQKRAAYDQYGPDGANGLVAKEALVVLMVVQALEALRIFSLLLWWWCYS